jgi:hypothetical protein
MDESLGCVADLLAPPTDPIPASEQAHPQISVRICQCACTNHKPHNRISHNTPTDPTPFRPRQTPHHRHQHKRSQYLCHGIFWHHQQIPFQHPTKHALRSPHGISHNMPTDPTTCCPIYPTTYSVHASNTVLNTSMSKDLLDSSQTTR